MFTIFSRHFDIQSSDTYSTLIRALGEAGAHVGVWADLYDQMLTAGFRDLPQVERIATVAEVRGSQALLSVGGDGTFLAAAKMVMGSDVAVLGINRGRLGFLSDVAPDQICQAVADLMAGRYRTSDVPVINMYADGIKDPIGFAINEFAISKCDNSSMLTLDTFVDGDYLTTFWADGLIVATSTGSTAYSLSVGGPIVAPTSHNLILTPVAPHNLSIRPLVLPDDVVINIVVDGRAPNVMASFDGQTHLMPNGGKLRIAKASMGVKRIQLSSYSFFRTLREKLLWGADARNPLNGYRNESLS